MTGRRTAPIAALLLAACAGGWEDAPLLPGFGEVEGAIAGPVDPARAWVAASGQPESFASVDEDGRFLLTRVASGKALVVGSDGLGGSFAREVVVYAERRVQLAVTVAPGATIEGLVTLEGLALPLPARVALEGAPQGVETDAAGRFSLSGLPAGCHGLVASRAGFVTVRRTACVEAGERAWLSIHLRRDGASPPARALCESCEGASECADGTCAALVEGGPKVCTRTCEDDEDCPSGTTCAEEAGGHCAPRGVACGTFLDTSEEKGCERDADCGERDDERARCVDQRCTFVCDEDDECPQGRTCEREGEDEGTCR